MPYLAAPQILDDLSISQIIEEIKTQFLEKHPDTSFDEASPLYEMTAIFSYRETLLRARINDLTQKLLQKLKEVYEEKTFVTGTRAYYEKKIKEISGVLDIDLQEKDKGVIEVFVLFSDETKKNNPNVLDELKDHLQSSKNKLLSDTLIIEEARPKPFSIKAHLILEQGTQIDIETAKNVLKEKITPFLRVGHSLSLSTITALLWKEGINDIKILEPSDSLIVPHGTIPILKEITLSYA